MKKFGLLVTLIIWMLLTIILTLSIIGWIILLHKDSGFSSQSSDEARSTWMKIGLIILNKIIE